MTIIKQFVDPKYHRFIQEGEKNPNVLMQQLKISDSNKQQTSEKILNIPQQVTVSREENESLPVVAPKQKSPLLHQRPRVLSVSEISNVVESAGPIPNVSYEELQIATDNWNPNVVLGKGGFGTVFKGTWKRTQVAIKRIEQKDDPEAHSIQIKQSITELYCLNSYRHDNILPLYAYSIGGPQPCLVYQFMPGGCLERRLRVRDPEKVLKWPQRLNIAIGTARGLQYLHTIGDKPLIHGDIKSANILLDLNDIPRIGDFGLAREGPRGEYTHIQISRIHGTRPYLPDDFLRSHQFSTKVDTYSFGIVLFELATSLPAYSKDRQDKFLKDHVEDFEGNVLELKDARAAGGEGIFLHLLQVGKECVRKLARTRPEMVQVLTQLEEGLKK